jgi:DNA-binding CsgD family transcriptional regulator
MAAISSEERRRRARDLVRRVGRKDSAADVLAEASTQLRRLLSFDAAVWLSTDPITGLPVMPTRVEDVEPRDPRQCADHWRHEFLVEDVNLFRDLARAPVPAAALRATLGDPRRSTRYRTFLQPDGFSDELRTVLRVGQAPWGAVSLFRRDGEASFDRRDVDLMADLSEPLGQALRQRARPVAGNGHSGAPAAPGVLLFSGTRELMAIDEQARTWLDELPAGDRFPAGLGVALPNWMAVLAARAAADHAGVTARVRVRTRRGRWLVCHASRLHDAAGPDRIALVVDAASPGDVAPILTAAWELTAREQQITYMIARGADTNEIARTLFLSHFTVRDHIKAIFGKVGVTSRGQLVARLYTEFYEPLRLGGGVEHVNTR